MAGLGVGEALAIVALLPPALHAVRILAEDIRGIKDAPSDIANITTELDNIEGVLETLQKALGDEHNLDDDFKELVGSKHIEQAVKACDRACTSFRTRLQKWRKHSTEEKMHWWDRAKVGFFGAKKVEALITDLNTCKATISLALNSANLYVSMNIDASPKSRQLKRCSIISNWLTVCSLAAGAQHHATKELLKQREDDTRKEGALVVKKTESAISSLATLSLDDDDEEEIDLDSYQDIKKDIKQARANVQDYKELLATVLIRYEGQRTGLKIKNVEIRGESKAMVGIQNMDGTEGELNVNIEDVIVDGKSKAVVGFQKDVNTSNIFN
jgi:hypothetical protein